MHTHWPNNRTINIVCHGHSVPAGYFATPFVDTFNAYPHILHKLLKERFPFAVINVIVTAIGGENSESGAKRFQREVLCHRPDVITIDYGLNDRGIGLDKARTNWKEMIEKGLSSNTKIILLTPTFDLTCDNTLPQSAEQKTLLHHAEQIRQLAAEYSIGLADSYSAFENYCKTFDISNLLSWCNHPNYNGHKLVANEILQWFPAHINVP